jgi:anti-anti-sigma regulatory factor
MMPVSVDYQFCALGWREVLIVKSKLRQWVGDVPLTNPIERRQASVFQWVLIVWIILAAIDLLFTYVPLIFPSLSSNPVPAGPMPPIFVVIILLLQLAGILLIASPAAALVLLRRGRFRMAVIVSTLGLLLAHTIATFILGVTNSAVFVVFQIPIALAGLLAGRRLLLTVAGWSIAVILVVTFLESFSPPLAGFFAAVPGPDGTVASPLAGQSLGLTIGFFIGVTVLLTVLLDRFGGALRDALNTAFEREEELVGIRASLEQTVAERTAALQTALNDVQARAAEQQRLFDEIETQRVMIKDLSVPVIPISSTTLVMPLVGALDSTRLRQLQEQSLQALERTSARTLVFDITGVPIVDTQVAQGLLMTVRAARLLGAHVVLVGIRPEVAQSLVGLGLDLRDISTFSDLQSALDRVAA